MVSIIEIPMKELFPRVACLGKSSLQPVLQVQFDNSHEFVMNHSHGMDINPTTSYNPEQNDISEQGIGTTKHSAGAFRKESSLPQCSKRKLFKPARQLDRLEIISPECWLPISRITSHAR